MRGPYPLKRPRGIHRFRWVLSFLTVSKKRGICLSFCYIRLPPARVHKLVNLLSHVPGGLGGILPLLPKGCALIRIRKNRPGRLTGAARIYFTWRISCSIPAKSASFTISA